MTQEEAENKIVDKIREIAGSGNVRAYSFITNVAVGMLLKGESHTNVMLFLESHDKDIPKRVG